MIFRAQIHQLFAYPHDSLRCKRDVSRAFGRPNAILMRLPTYSNFNIAANASHSIFVLSCPPGHVVDLFVPEAKSAMGEKCARKLQRGWNARAGAAHSLLVVSVRRSRSISATRRRSAITFSFCSIRFFNRTAFTSWKHLKVRKMSPALNCKQHVAEH